MIDPAKLPAPPVAAVRPHRFERHGRTVTDNYAWLRDPGYPTVENAEILAYLNAENGYFEAAMKPLDPLVETLFVEMKGRLKEDDAGVPQQDGDWLYWWAFAPGAQYRRWYRKRADGFGEEQLILDEPAEAEGKPYFRLGAMRASPDGRLLAWSADASGAERFTLRIRDLATMQDIETVSDVVNHDIAWAADGASLVYTEVNAEWRSYKALLHKLGTDPEHDRELYRETENEGFTVAVGRTQDRRWIGIHVGDNATDEIRLLDATNTDAELILVSPRKERRRYSVDSAHGKLWILTNDEHVNFRLAEADWANPDDWRTVIAGSDRVYLKSLHAFGRHLAIERRVDGLDEIALRDYATGAERILPFAEESYSVSLAGNPEPSPSVYRLSYSSMVTPDTVYDFDPAIGALATLKVREVPSGYDASRYVTKRLMVPARDGKQVPVSIVHRTDFKIDGSGPLFLYAYGAYGIAMPPRFATDRLSLLDRGFAYAIAHIRGGDDMGYGWYLDGTNTKRWNSFTDFVDAAQGLIAAGYAAPGRIAINGGSAGGGLMGVVANTDPELWGAIVADVPFVDVVNTMLDETLPLTPGEWPEWGNPVTDPDAFDLLISYSAYDNVKPQAYPPMLITGGLHDPRVTYWEPAKWAAKLRATKTDANPLLLKINMGAGHGGRSGRYEALRERAEAYAFAIEELGASG
ncbi:MAG: S9 family peptidase [Sphingomonadaceae bacterium]|nr:S9 family peptidase [Sphingomonadaceae bacterium]